jgi:thioredoxin 1
VGRRRLLAARAVNRGIGCAFSSVDTKEGIMAEPMETTFVDVEDEAGIERLFDRSREAPIVVFKHDPWCSISLVAQRKLRALGREVPTIDVADSRSLSLGLADRVGVKHESPQVLILRHGRAVWSASHGAITAAAVDQALDEA